MLVGFNVTSLAKWGYPPSTHFINPMEPEFAPKAITASDFTQDAIERKLAWFYSTDAYGLTQTARSSPATLTGNKR
jgi:bilirubin oxidase